MCQRVDNCKAIIAIAQIEQLPRINRKYEIEKNITNARRARPVSFDIRSEHGTYISFKPTGQSKIFPNAAFGYWKVVEPPLRLKSQLTIPRMEALRYASGDEEIRSQLEDEFGDALFEDFSSVQKALVKRLAEWGSDDEEDEGAPAKSLPQSKKKKLLSADTWQRDARLYELGMGLREHLPRVNNQSLSNTGSTKPLANASGYDQSQPEA